MLLKETTGKKVETVSCIFPESGHTASAPRASSAAPSPPPKWSYSLSVVREIIKNNENEGFLCK